MNPCFIVTLTSIYIAASLRNNQIESTDKLGNSQSEGGSLLKVNYIEIDLSKKRSTSEYIYKQDGDVETYRAKDGYAIKKYTDGPDVKWTSDGTTYLSRVVKNKQQDGTFTYKVVRYDPTQSSVPSIIRVVTEDPADQTKTKENDASQYEIKRDNNIVTCKLNDVVKCLEVGHKDRQVWKQKPENPDEVLEYVLFNTRAKTIVFVFEKSISVYKVDDGVWHQAYYGEPKTVELDLMKKKSTNEFDYTNKDGIGTYTSKPGYFFNKVRKSCSTWGSSCCTSGCWSWLCCLGYICSDCCCLSGSCTCPQTIYEPDEFKHYAIRVVSDGLSCCCKVKNVSIDFVNGQSKYFWANGGELVDVKATILVPVTVGKKHSSLYYDYVCENDRHTYTTKYNCFFDLLKYAPTSKCTPVIIWRPSLGSYISKTILDESGEEHVITTNLSNGMVKRFVKSGDKWTENNETKPT